MEENPSKNYNQPASYQNTGEKSSKIFLFLEIFFIFVIAGAIVWFLFFSNKESIESTSETVSCNTWDCFIDSSENCSKSNFTNTATFNFFGVETTITNYYEIPGEKSNNCIFKIRTEEQHVNYSAQLIQQLLDGGIKQEEIDQQETLANEQSDLLEGRAGTCEFNPQDLSDMLTRWSVGSFSGGASCALGPNGSECTYTGDFEAAENCQGEYFSSEL